MSIVNPAIPYVGGIPGGCHGGRTITIHGKIPHHHLRPPHHFAINLSCGPQVEPDTALHFNGRFNEACIVRNHLHHNSWGTEERHGGIPFHKGQAFEVTILVQPQHYNITVNGRHFCNFNHHIPKERVQYLLISGGIEVNTINFGGPGSQHPPPHHGGRHPIAKAVIGAIVDGISHAHQQPGYPPAPGPSGGVLYPGQPVFNPPVPFTNQITGGLYPGRMINISGVPKAGAQNFAINLQCGAYEGVDIAFHFNPRFNESCVVRNSLMSGAWGAEDRSAPFFPFQHNANFDILILVEQASFKVAINNQHFTEFYHRLQPFTRADTLKISGDVRLSQVKIQ